MIEYTEVAESVLPTWDQLAVKLGQIADERCEWAGIPLPLVDPPLVVEPRFTYQFGKTDEDTGDKLINMWYSDRRRELVFVVRNKMGKIEALTSPECPVQTIFKTFGVIPAWTIVAELKAQEKLLELVGEHKFKQYLLTGAFIETSKRSGVTYIFRRLRPTIAIRAARHQYDCSVFLAALCLHPIGYYSGSWAGAMVPTDDVIAHLVMMRGDEPYFWRKSNQHSVLRPEAGL